MSKYGFELIDIDHHFNCKDYDGIADIIAKKDGVKCIIDIKTTGLIDDKWSKFGWHNDFVSSNDNLMIQARHYKMLAKEEWGIENIPFYFFVFSTTNSVDCKVFEVECHSESLEMHKRNSEGAKKILDNLLEVGFKAIPSVKACLECPLKDSCDSYTNVPPIVQIEC